MLFAAVILLSVGQILCLFEDQVGKFDWRQQFVGHVIGVDFDGAPGDLAHRAFISTDLGVVGSINLKSGSINWRNILAAKKPTTLALLGESVIVSSNGGKDVHCFDANAGLLMWEKSLSVSACELSQLVKISKSTVVVLACGQVFALDNKGNVKWKQQIPNAQDCSFLDYHEPSDSLYAICSVSSSRAQSVTKLSAKSGDVERSESSDVFSWFRPELCTGYQSILVCRDDVSVGGDHDHGFRIIDLDKHELTKFSDVSLMYTAINGKIDSFGFFQDYLIFAKIEESDVRRSVTFSFFNILTSQFEKEKTSIAPLGPDVNSIEKVFVTPLKKSGAELTFRFLVIGGDHSLSLITQSGRTLWSRQEALASIVSVEMLDLPLSESERDIESEFTSKQENVLSMFIKRITSQAVQIQHATLRAADEAVYLFQTLSNLSVTKGGSIIPPFQKLSSVVPKSTGLAERDYFNLHKMIVVITEPGKAFGIDNRNGAIVWQSHLGGLRPFTVHGKISYPLFVLRTTAHYPHQPELVVFGRLSGQSSMVVFNPITGETIRTIRHNCAVEQAVLLPHTTQEDSQILLTLCKDTDKVSVYPPDALKSLTSEALENIYAFSVHQESGAFSGYRIRPSPTGALAKQLVWSTKLINSPKDVITDVKLRRLTERVHSQGRVLGDRNVLYKYLNPNLAAVVVENKEEGKDSVVIYLIDVVSGQVITKATHKRAAGPVHLLHCENWIVYSFWNEKARRGEFAVLELYEGADQFDSTRFSSLRPSPMPPIVAQQAYIFPQGVNALAVTETDKGITARHLIVAMPFGGLLELPKMFLDPRRPLLMTMDHREEGLIPYIPELPIATDHIVNYNQSVFGVRGIHTAASGLESTSLVFAYGLDLFYTRVTPSGTFDILKDDFDHWFIAAVLFALLLACVVTKKLSRHKDLQAAWK